MEELKRKKKQECYCYKNNLLVNNTFSETNEGTKQGNQDHYPEGTTVIVGDSIRASNSNFMTKNLRKEIML